jgi:hypothetical protein
MSIDFDAIATALAARYASGLVTPPAGYQNIRTATAYPPNAMPSLPAVIVFGDTGEFEYSAGKRDSNHEFLIRFYFNQAGDIKRDSAALLKWLGVLIMQLQGASQLGGTVTWARIARWRMGQMTYGGYDYSGLELTATVNVNEPWAPVA